MLLWMPNVEYLAHLFELPPWMKVNGPPRLQPVGPKKELIKPRWSCVGGEVGNGGCIALKTPW